MFTFFSQANKNKIINTIGLAFIVLITACSDNNKADTSSKQAAVATQHTTPTYPLSNISQKAWLREQLPNNALAYARVPSVWYLFSGQDNGFKYAQGNPSFVEQVKKIQTAVKQTLFTHFTLDNGLAKFLLQHLDGPIEAAVLQPEIGQMMPVVALASQLKFSSLADFNTAFSAMANEEEMLTISQASDDSGHGEFMFQQVKVLYYFDQQTGRFSLFGGIGVESQSLKNIKNGLVANPQHPMFTSEITMDSSGLGLFVWLNPKIILPAVMPMIGEQQVAQLKVLGVADINGIALGYGASDGKTRLKALIDMPKVAMRQYLPAINNQINLNSSGQLNSFALLSLPTAADLVNFEQGLLTITGQLPESYQAFKTSLKNEFEISLDELLVLLGPEVFYFSDQISEFSALKVNDETKLNALLTKLQTKKLIELSQHKAQGALIYQATSTGDMMNGLYESIFKDAPWLAETLTKVKSRSYWLVEDGYLIFSSIPQPLIERSLYQDKQSINTWLSKHQKQNLSGSLLAYSTTIDNLSRNSYHIYLAVLQFLADVSGAEFDIFSLPLANELAFAERGTIGVQLDLADPFIALEFTFEQSAFDILYGGAYQSTAVIGILAGIAIPAYQDYTERAKAAAAAK